MKKDQKQPNMNVGNNCKQKKALNFTCLPAIIVVEVKICY